MKKTLLTSLASLALSLCILPVLQGATKAPSINIRFYKNIEFMGFVYYLGWIGPNLERDDPTVEIGGQKVQKSTWHAYGFSVYQNYKNYTDSKYLSEIVTIGSELDYTPIVNLMMLTRDFPNAQLNHKVSDELLAMFSRSGNIAQGRMIAEEFLITLNAFYREVDFDKYLNQSEEHYERAKNEVIMAKPTDQFIVKMESFYQRSFNSYTLVPSLLVPSGVGFAFSKGKGTKEAIYNIFGAHDIPDLSHPYYGFGNSRRLMELSIHEFGHSFVNPVVDLIPDTLVKATERLFGEIAQAMDQQGYPNWKTSLYEHFVRAGEVIIARSLGLKQNAEELENWYIEGRNFIYLPTIMNKLEEYRMGNYSSYEETVLAAAEALKTEVKVTQGRQK